MFAAVRAAVLQPENRRTALLALIIAFLALALLFAIPALASLFEPRETFIPGSDITAAVPITPEDRVGSGSVIFERTEDIEHVVQHGETLSEIAYAYDIDHQSLATYNHLTNPNAIRAGQKLVIPSVESVRRLKDEVSEQELLQTAVVASAPVSNAGGVPLVIDAERALDGTAVTARLFVAGGLPEGFSNYEWDLGNGYLGFRPTLSVTYDQPGTYTVKLRVNNGAGSVIESNRLHINVPYPGDLVDLDQTFLTIGSVEEVFSVEGDVVDVADFGSLADSPIELLAKEGDFSMLRSNAPGYYAITSQIQDYFKQTFVFVSPFESVHSDRADMNWYRTQFNTGSPSNCGPSVVSMAVAWARGEYLAVSAVREQIGWRGNGGTSFSELISQMRNAGVDARLTPTESAQDVFNIVDEGNIAVVLYHSGAVSWTTGAPEENLVGRYYNDSVGHYVIVKGYTTDGKYFVVYDPIPSDWVSNSKRYSDGVSMMGRNRYYPVDEVYGSIRRSGVIEIRR